MTTTPDPDAQLRTLERREWRSAAEALAAIAEVTGSINAHVAATTGLTPHPAVPDRLEEWIGRLSDVAAEVARAFDAFTYSVGVSIPGGVSVSISWQANA